ncbi:MAG: DNA polymerase III subunit alpha [Ktedonobacterales bacterium]
MTIPLIEPSADTDKPICRQAQERNSRYAELHCASAFSLLRAGSSVEALVERAVALGVHALALTDFMTLAGVVRFQAACASHGVKAIVGVELAVADPVFGDVAKPAHLVVLAEDAVGYARLCRLLTEANLAQPEAPVIPFADLAAQPAGLILLTGGRDGTLVRLVSARKRQAAEDVARHYAAAFGPSRVYVELQHHRFPESITLMRHLADIAASAGLPVIATNGVHHATREDYALYDLLTCTRLGISVDTPHAERPRNDEAHLKSAGEMAALFAPLPWGPTALAASAQIAERCQRSLLRTTCTAPHVPLPAGETTPHSWLRTLCEEGLATRYATTPAALTTDSPQRRQLAHELQVIAHLELEEFFLVVRQIVTAAREMGIRISGRGSAANSLVAYLLGITGVDPIQHGLLFERFLNPDRRGMPDIDLDVQSDRRDELIHFVERTYTHEHAAMVANVITYRPRLALRDAAKALGYPQPPINQLTKVLPHHSPREDLPRYHHDVARVIAALPPGAVHDRCLRRLPLLLDIAMRLCGLPRHLSLHNGGMVLTRESLLDLLPVRISANGVRALEVDKDDVERLGLIKFDLLGLRTLGAVEEALSLIGETTGARPDIDHLPTTPPDPRTMRLIRAGQTLAVFQIESPGQWHLLAQTQPQTFDDLIVQTALFRPGPIQGGFVHPYIERRQAQQAYQTQRAQHGGQRDIQQRAQRDAVQTPWKGASPDDFWTTHPLLGPILQESEGILLFQEQILEIAHAFAGLSYAQADGFRRAMSHARDRHEMEAMRTRFVAGACLRGETRTDAERVFDAIGAFIGYGFCKSHAAEFARTIYQTAWLKAHYPAHYLAAFLSSQPAGFFPPHVVLEEAKLLGIPVLPIDVNRSEDRFSVERVGAPGYERWAIRIGLRQVAQIGDDLARTILWDRRGAPGAQGAYERPFTTLADLCARLRPTGLTWKAAEALVLSGACDGLSPRMDRRRRLWQLHLLWPLISARCPRIRARRQSSRKHPADEQPVEQLVLDWDTALIAADTAQAVPPLPALDRDARLALDYTLLGLSAGVHPMHLSRRTLRRRGVQTIADLRDVPAGRMVRVAGWPISAQRPPTAKGMGFLVLEDETGRLPVALPPQIAMELHRLIRSARIVAVVGRVERVRWYRSLLAFQICDLGSH